MPLFLSESDVAALVDMPTIIGELESVFAAEARGETFNLPRHRFNKGAAKLNVMLAGDTTSARHAVRAYGTIGSSVSHIYLYGRDGLLAIVEARLLSAMRTGAASAVAVKRLAAPDAGTIGLVGAGRQAETQLTAIAAVRPVREVLAYARNCDNLEAFCARMEKLMGVPVRPVASAQAACSGADIVVAATNAKSPVVFADWLKPGAHVVTMGANAADRKEVDLKMIEQASFIVTDDLAQARIEAGEFIELDRAGSFDWTRISTLAQLVAKPPVSTGGLTIFKSLGAAIEDLASSSYVYDEALKRGLGRTL